MLICSLFILMKDNYEIKEIEVISIDDSSFLSLFTLEILYFIILRCQDGLNMKESDKMLEGKLLQ